MCGLSRKRQRGHRCWTASAPPSVGVIQRHRSRATDSAGPTPRMPACTACGVRAAFTSVHDYETWDSHLGEDGDIRRHVCAGDLVPINIGGDGAFEIEVRVGSASSPAALSEREQTYLDVASEPYRFMSDGGLCLSGIEYVQGAPDGHVGRLALSPGEYAVVVHLIGWDREPGMLTASGCSPRLTRCPTSSLLPTLPDWETCLQD